MAAITGGASGSNNGNGIVDDVFPRNIGDARVVAFAIQETEIATGRGLNDSIQTAQLLPLGTGPGQRNTIDVTGSLPPASPGTGLTGSLPDDIDYYAVDLRAGDILDTSGIGSIGGVDIFFANGRRWFAFEDNQAILYPANSPLMTVGNAVAAQVVPSDGRYYIRLANSGLSASSYTLGLRVYRPVMESQPIGAKQKVFLDFDGATIPNSLFTPGLPGTTRIPSLFDSLNLLNLEPQDEGPFINKVLANLNDRFRSVVTNGGNGDFASTGIAGQFGIEFLNSRDNPDPFNDPLVTRAHIGGSTADINILNILGVSQSLDVGNFDTSEIVLLPVEFFEAAASTFPISNASSLSDAIAFRLATTIAHEIGHSFGLRHTDPLSIVNSIIDTGGPIPVQGRALGVGPDGIFGTADDVQPQFPVFKRFNPVEGFIGDQYVAPALAWVLSTGTRGTPITGTVFNDFNQDGRLTSGETGLSGIRVFVDANNNGQFDSGEVSTLSNANGTYSLAVGAGTFRIRAVAPNSFANTTLGQNITVGTAGAANINLGLTRVQSDITGTVFNDLNGNGTRESGEGPQSGVFVYLDLDGDNRPDVGEPSSITDATGNYRINFPGAGTYFIREVLPSGYEQTFPLIPQSAITLPNGQNPDEHRVVFNGTSLTQNFNFGNRPNLDFGDLPDSYGTTLAAGGPSHGILAGLSLGGAPDREADGQPTAGANGDDVSGIVGPDGNVVDDEDGVQLLSPIGPGAAATFRVNLNNATTQTGYLRAWFDFNGNGRFESSELAINDFSGLGVRDFQINVPSTVVPGSLYARFRYSTQTGVSFGGQADAGEVEDYVFTVSPSANLANPDTFTVTRNSQANVLDVLANDFDNSVTGLRITSLDRLGNPPTRGQTLIAAGGRSILYTPPTGFTGTDTFQYTVTSLSGQRATTTVTLNVTFLSDSPIAVDDSFDIPQGSVNIPINVLDNDVPSRSGGLTITSVSPGDQGGQTTLAGGRQAITYTPRAGFTGTEQFIYNVTDASGGTSRATVTVNMQPGSRNDDLAGYTIDFLDPINNRPITNVQAGDEFLVRVSIQDLRSSVVTNQGVFSGFLDLLYTDQLLSVVPSSTNRLGFEINFGPQFTSSDSGEDISNGDANTPGLLNEVGSAKPISAQPVVGEGVITLFTVRMRAAAPGVAVFKANPADLPENETSLLGLQTALTPSQLRLGTAELTIAPAGTIFTRAVDDAFLDGRDSNGVIIVGGSPARLNVLANDIIGPNVTLSSLTILQAPGRGTAVVGSDNTISYTPDNSLNDNDTFTYAIVTSDGVRSTARVDLTAGSAAANDQMSITLNVVDGTGRPITGNIPVNTRFGVQFVVDDLRTALQASPQGVFAAFADILYNAGLVRPSNTILTDAFNFDVVFSDIFGSLNSSTGQVSGAFGISDTPGIIDEFGSIVAVNDPNFLPPGAVAGDPVLLATLYFDAIAPGRVDFKTSPPDVSPQRDSLFFTPDSPIPLNLIRFGATSITIGGSAASPEGEVRQNGLLPADVNDDGRVTPIDALLIINEISQRRRAEGETAAQRFSKFADVSGDGRITPLDALQVISSITSRNRIMAPVVTPTIVNPTPLTADAYRTIVDTRARMTTAFANYNAITVSMARSSSFAPPVGEGMASADAEKEDLLNLLAQDVANTWQ